MPRSHFLVAVFTLLGFLAQGQKASWSFELMGGLPYNLPTSLTIKQQGEPSLRLNARYSSEPFVSPGYYIYRVTRWQENSSWELEFIHHKLYLDNRPDEVTFFHISHGYNMLMVNRAYKKPIFEKHSFLFRLGAGIVIAHPENMVRGMALDESGGIGSSGYYISGPVLNVAVAKRFYLVKRLFIITELKFNPSVSWVPVADGRATVWNMPFTFAFGMGFDFISGGEKF